MGGHCRMLLLPHKTKFIHYFMANFSLAMCSITTSVVWRGPTMNFGNKILFKSTFQIILSYHVQNANNSYSIRLKRCNPCHSRLDIPMQLFSKRLPQLLRLCLLGKSSPYPKPTLSTIYMHSTY